MAEIINIGQPTTIIGCLDPLANNYNPFATQPCVNNICCTYTNPLGGGTLQTFGCYDPLASNYNPSAANACTDCCEYTVTTQQGTLSGNVGVSTDPTGPGGLPTGTGTGSGTGSGTDLGGGITCRGPFSFSADGVVIGVDSEECCNKNILGPAPGFDYQWNGIECILTQNCPDTICIDCSNLDWWNDKYITNHNGQSLSTTNSVLWQEIINLVVNSGETVSVNITDGEPTNQQCCQGVFRNGACVCQAAPIETYTGTCISDLTQFMNLISTPAGYNFFTNNFYIIGPALGLTTQQTNFVKLNINNTGDSNNNGIQDLTEARLILSNALNVTGGFFVNFGVITNTPNLVSKTECNNYGGYWSSLLTTNNNLPTTTFVGDAIVGTDVSIGTCMCKPIVDQCEIDLSQVQVVSTVDFFNNPIKIVTLKPGQTVQTSGSSISLGEACCNRLVNDNPTLGWMWQRPYCLANPKEDCLPATFGLNEDLMDIPPCPNNLEISMWVYFTKPENPCQPIPDPPDNDVIIIDGKFCDVTLTPNTATIIPTLGNDIPTETLREVGGIIDLGVGSNTETGVDTTPNCCYNISYPIQARISLTDTTLNSNLTQTKEYISTVDYFDRWVQIKATLNNSANTALVPFGVKLEIYQGLNCCCEYEIYVDDIQVNCPKPESVLVTNNIQCPGFNINRVIDNKKSWVYNPGLPGVGISTFDEIERQDGSFGTINGEGSINRTFAPSPDANIPWRYTDYWKQSSVYENHSNLVLNSKELWLTFDMCAKCPISGSTLVCPEGFALSANTNVCYAEIIEKIFQDGDEFIFMDGDNYIFQ